MKSKKNIEGIISLAIDNTYTEWTDFFQNFGYN